MIDVQEVVMEAVPVRKGAAVEVHELRKEFTMRDRKKGRFGKAHADGPRRRHVLARAG